MRRHVLLAALMAVVAPGADALALPGDAYASVEASCDPDVLFPSEVTCDHAVSGDGSVSIDVGLASKFGVVPGRGTAEVTGLVWRDLVMTEPFPDLRVTVGIDVHWAEAFCECLMEDVDDLTLDPLMLNGTAYLEVGVGGSIPCFDGPDGVCSGGVSELLFDGYSKNRGVIEHRTLNWTFKIRSGPPGTIRLFAGAWAHAQLHDREWETPEIGSVGVSIDATVTRFDVEPF